MAVDGDIPQNIWHEQFKSYRISFGRDWYLSEKMVFRLKWDGWEVIKNPVSLKTLEMGKLYKIDASLNFQFTANYIFVNGAK